MSVEKRFSVSLDVKQPTSNRDIEVVEGDTGNILVVTLTDNGEPVDLTDCKVCAVFAKSNGTAMQDTDGNGMTIAGEHNNEITIELYNTSFSPGLVTCEVQVFSGENMGTLITSAQFNFNCRRGIANADTVQSTDEWPLLVGLLQQVAEASDELEELNAQTIEAAAQAGEAIDRANTAAENADAVSAAAAEEAKGIAQAAADSATATAQAAADNAAEIAQTAAENAMSVATEAAAAAETITATATAAEAERTAAELERANAEALRRSAENTRQTNEGTRQAQEQARQTGTAAAISAATEATNRANTAAERAEQAASGTLPKHNTTHASDGSDPITPDMIGAACAPFVVSDTISGYEMYIYGTQTITVNGVKPTSCGDLYSAPTATPEQDTAFNEAQLKITAQGINSITVECRGVVPPFDLPIEIEVRN